MPLLLWPCTLQEPGDVKSWVEWGNPAQCKILDKKVNLCATDERPVHWHRPSPRHSRGPLAPSIAQYYISLLSGMWNIENIDNQYRNPNMNNKDHLVGQLFSLHLPELCQVERRNLLSLLYLPLVTLHLVAGILIWRWYDEDFMMMTLWWWLYDDGFMVMLREDDGHLVLQSVHKLLHPLKK